MAASINSETTLTIGTRVQGGEYTYTVEDIIGQGGFGITYKVSAMIKTGKIEHKNYFALKELFLEDFCERDRDTNSVRFSSSRRATAENSKKDFLAEARRLNSLDHPNIVAVNEVFEANDTAYYVMEYLTGDSLRRYIEQNEEPLSQEQTLTLFTPLLNAANYLHANNLTHLDIKPDNIMLKPGDNGELTPVLIDFGLSKHYDEKGKATSTIRMSGLSHGYAPTEQYEGITTFTPQADIYAIAATMLYCVTGNDPVRASQASEQWIKSALAAKVDDTFAEAICHAMCIMKDDRTQSVSDFAKELGVKLTAVPSSVSGFGGKKKPKKPKKPIGTDIIDPNPSPRPRWVTPLLIGLGVLVVGVIAFFAFNAINSDDDPIDTTVFNDSTVLNDTIDTTAVQPVEVPAAPAVDVVDDAVDDGYSVAYAGALNLYNSRKYADCKRECQKLLRQYTSREQKQQLTQLIEYCDTALDAEESAQQQAAQQPTQQAAPATSSGGSSSNLPDRAVDLGLPSGTLWADRNVGASSSSDYGDYFAWGETSTKSDYSWSTYTHCDGNWDNCHNIGSNISGTRYDVARQKWGGGWKMPTKAQWQELKSKCTWTWITQGGHNGYKVTGPNGNSIFLPAAGDRYGTSSSNVGSYGGYWSSTLDESDTNYAWGLDFNGGLHYVGNNYRSYGHAVRPVTEK